MSDARSNTATTRTSIVERGIKQPVREAVREALAERDAADVRRSEESSATDDRTSVDEDDSSSADEGTDSEDGSSRVSGRRLVLLAGLLAGVAYAVSRRRGADDGDEGATSTDAGDQIGDGERSTAPAEDAASD